MATLLSLKRMLAPSDDFYNSGLRASLGDSYSSTGGKNTSWGGTFKTSFVNQVRSAKSFNASSFGSFSDFKILSQSGIRSRIGYQVIFDPATPSGADYYTFVSAGGVSRGSSPWDAKANFDGGAIPFQGVTLSDISSGAYDPSPAQYEWFYDGTNFLYYDGDRRQYYSAGSPEIAEGIFYFDGRGYAPLIFFYDENRFNQGVDALFGNRPWTATNLVIS